MLKRLARKESAKVQLLQILFDMWRDHPQVSVRFFFIETGVGSIWSFESRKKISENKIRIKISCTKFDQTSGKIVRSYRTVPQMLVVLVDKCIRAQIVDTGSVARWIFSPEMANYFHRFFIWEVKLNSVII